MIYWLRKHRCDSKEKRQQSSEWNKYLAQYGRNMKRKELHYEVHPSTVVVKAELHSSFLLTIFTNFFNLNVLR